ncbi:MAG: hypothetical protein NTW86_07565 [Candidatus Sumerlaeota bacterium]|nr:hypothetical protein [Candidatus Sumerlaeota bacterium]
MHLQQTKAESRASGGPQYYFRNLPDPVKEFLRKRGACPVVLQTPYGIAKSPFTAVDRDHKIGKDGRPVAGKVGHDRIQQGDGDQSIGEAIRYWYGISGGQDFERIELDRDRVIHPEGHFILMPTAVKMRGKHRPQVLEKVNFPLSFHHDYQSKLWRQQIEARREESSSDVQWAASQIARVVDEHRQTGARNILESDLLRTAGALSLLGLNLSAYLGQGYDCASSQFRFGELPTYHCPVEIKKQSKGFNYQVIKYFKLPRAVVLCMEHNLVNPPDHIDFIELPTLAKHLTD